MESPSPDISVEVTIDFETSQITVSTIVVHESPTGFIRQKTIRTMPYTSGNQLAVQ